MKHLITTLIIFISISNILAQDKHDFSIEFNVNGSYHNMERANNYIAEDPAYKYMSVSPEKGYLNTLNLGLDYTLGISYQPFNFMDFGVFVNYQSSRFNRTSSSQYYVDPVSYPDSTNTQYGNIRNETNAFSFGISSTLYINKLLHFDRFNTIFLKKIIISTGIKGGIGFSSFNEQSGFENSISDYTNFQYMATNFNGRAELGVAYPICNHSFFSSIGVKIGYQLFKTSPLKNHAGVHLYPNDDPFSNDDYLDPDKKVSLDFSGVYYGVYLRIGKH